MGSTHSSELLETDTPTDQQTDRQISSIPLCPHSQRAEAIHTQTTADTGREQRHSGVGQHTEAPAKAPDGTLGSITTAAAPLILMYSELGYRCGVGILLDISLKFHPPESAAWRKDPSPFKSKLRSYVAFPAAQNDNS